MGAIADVWGKRAAVQPYAYSPLLQDALCKWLYVFTAFLMVIEENVVKHDDTALLHKAIMVVTCHYGQKRGIHKYQRKRQRGSDKALAWRLY